MVDQEGESAFNSSEIPALKRAGISIAHVSTLSSDLSTAQSQIPVEVGQMRLHNVNFIIWEGGVIYLNLWANEATKENYWPQYSADDYQSGVDDLGLKYINGRFSGIGWATRRKSQRHQPGYQPSSYDQQCASIVTKAGMAMDPATDFYWEVTRYCGEVDALVSAAQAVGPNLTRTQLAAAMQRIGRMPYYDVGPGNEGGSFGPGKTDAADYVMEVRADMTCKCWVPAGNWFPAQQLSG